VASAVRKTSVPAHRGLATLTFAHLPLGSYAIVVLHDENENMKLDRNAFGKPKEGWGMSNNPKAHMAAPPFAAARFTLRNNAKIAVHLRY
jgi:uncharacterized protein (DUF2141 family)